MDKTALVSLEVERGLEVVDVLERVGMKINVALWVYLPEYEDWRLVISGRAFETVNPRTAYRSLYKALDVAGFPIEKNSSTHDSRDERSIHQSAA